MRRTAAALVWLLLIFGCTAPQPVSDLASEDSGTTGALAAAAPNAPDDMRPSPEEILAEAGVELTLESLGALALDQRADPELRHWAAFALGRLGKTEALATLAQALEATPVDVRYGAVLGLMALDSPEGLIPLARALEDEDVHVRVVAVNAAGMIGGAGATTLLLERLSLADEPDAEVRFAAAAALGWQAGAQAVAGLEAALDDPAPKVRAAAAISLAAAGEERAVPTLVNSVFDAGVDEWQRVDAVQALEQLTGMQFGYSGPNNAPLSAAEQEQALGSILAWWQTARSQFEER